VRASRHSLARLHQTRRAEDRLGVSGQIAIDDVSKVYAVRGGTVEAVRRLTLTINAGEFVSLVGASGCGKSTLLTMVAGLVPASRGQIRIDNLAVTRPQTNIGFVFQDPVLLDWRRALDNVMLSVEGRKLPLADYRERGLRLLQSVGLAGFENRYPYELSGGMRQRVSICRALIHDPPVLLMDEPFGALDALTREQLMLDLLRVWQERRKTVLFVTHSISEAVFLSDRVIVLTQRPARIQETITIDLPRPRGLKVRQSPEFAGYMERILDIFQAQGILRE
jgi:NitT/TauT family transport system ATP-binding protein